MKRIKIKISLIIILVVLIFSISKYLNLFSEFNILTANIDRYNRSLVYPQCEFKGKDLDKMNKTAMKLGFKVVYVECELFYTRGMNSYYKIMNEEFKNKYGEDWLDTLYQMNKK